MSSISKTGTPISKFQRPLMWTSSYQWPHDNCEITCWEPNKCTKMQWICTLALTMESLLRLESCKPVVSRLQTAQHALTALFCLVSNGASGRHPANSSKHTNGTSRSWHYLGWMATLDREELEFFFPFCLFLSQFLFKMYMIYTNWKALTWSIHMVKNIALSRDFSSLIYS